MKDYHSDEANEENLCREMFVGDRDLNRTCIYANASRDSTVVCTAVVFSDNTCTVCVFVINDRNVCLSV